MRFLPGAMLCAALLFVPSAVAHGALELNEFDTYAISDFEGQEDSFPHEGFEIWDIYAGDGYLATNDTHGVYFKGNFAGDGTVRPSGSQEWTLRFTFDVGNDSYERTIVHDGSDATSDFDKFEWQLADGNVFQIHAWVQVPEWEGLAISNLVVLSSVDGEPRDIAPGGVYDPVTGQEVTVEAPPTPVFPALGEGRIVDAVELTGAAKFLEVSTTRQGDSFQVAVNNTLASQGQHFTLRLLDAGNWTVEGLPFTQSIDGGSSAQSTLRLTPPAGTVEPLQIDFMTDIGGLQTWYAYADAEGVHLTDDAEMANTFSTEPAGEDAPGVPVTVLLALLAVAIVARRRS